MSSRARDAISGRMPRRSLAIPIGQAATAGRSLLAAPVEILGARARRRRWLGDARALVPRILARDPAAVAACGSEAVIAHAELTSTDVVVVVVAPSAGPPCAVLKLPMTARAEDDLMREGRALAALHADQRLGDWRRLLPACRASGTLDGWDYRLDSALPGRVVLDRLGEEASRCRLLESAAETIHFLHRATATEVEADERLAERWIDAPANDLLARRAGLGLGPQLRRLREELRTAVIGRTLSAAWIHGDYWLGNLLFEADDMRPRGIVDWDGAGEAALPVIDLVHLLLYTRRLLSGRELGDIVLEQLREGDWSTEERHVLDRYGTWCHGGALSDRHLLLLAWLRHVAHHAQQCDVRAPGYWLWQRRNVRPVLASL